MTIRTHTLQGPDLEALLQRVPMELGADATIVAANKLRQGGLAGFFAKEVFEVVVEVPDEGSEPGTEPRRPAPSSTPRVSTEAIGFAGVLDRMVRNAGIGDQAPRPIGPALAAAHHEPGITRTTDGPEAADFELLDPVRIHRHQPVQDRHPVRAAAEGAAVSMPPPGAPVSGAMVLDPVVPLEPALDRHWLSRVGVPGHLASLLAPATSDPATELLRLMEHLVLPPRLPQGPGSVIAVVGARGPVMEVAEALASELSTSPDDILVAATTIRRGSVPEERRLTSIDQAFERRRSWRRRRHPTIVAVESAPGARRSSWATHLLEAIEPVMVWGVVAASRKSEDIRAWADRLGGLDALAVTDLGDTVSPASVLGAGVPVGLLDGQPATPSRWTAILSEHLAVPA